MPPALGLSLWALLAAQLFGASALKSAPFSVQADRLVAERGRYVAQGRVRFERQGAVIYADKLTFDEKDGYVIAEGSVTALEGNTVLTCAYVKTKVPELLGGLQKGELRIKSVAPGLQLSASALRRHGEDQLILQAEQMERTSARTFDVKSGSFTACDCGDDKSPSWRIRAGSASVDLDDGVWLYWPVFQVHDVPVFALPIYYLPLGDRRTGFLLPKPSYSSVIGAGISVPFFITLGRSWDSTIEASYYSARGPAAGMELRWAPSERSRGQIRARTVFDFGAPKAEPNFFSIFEKSRTSPRYRFVIDADHSTRWSAGHLAVDLNVLGDPAYLGDFADRFLSRQAEFTRSRITAEGRAGPLRIRGGLQLMQDLRGISYQGVQSDFRDVQLLSGQFRVSESNGAFFGPGAVRYRFADLRADAPAMALASSPYGALLNDARLLVSAFSAPRPDLTRFARADLREALIAPIDLGGLGTFEVSAAVRATVWGGRADGENVSRARVAPIFNARLFTELSRRFESLSGAYHSIRPQLDYALIPTVWRGGDDVFETRDEVDQLRAVSQFRARIDTDLWSAKGQRLGGLECFWGYDLNPLGSGEGEGSSEVVIRGDINVSPKRWPVTGSLNGRVVVDPMQGTVNELFAGVRLADRRGDSLSVIYGQLSDSPARYNFVAPEELVPSATFDRSVYIPVERFYDTTQIDVDDRLNISPWGEYRGLNLNATIKPLDALTLSFNAVLSFDNADDLQAAYNGVASTSILRSTRSALRWDSPCQCWNAQLLVTTARDREGVSVNLAVDLARLGSVGF